MGLSITAAMVIFGVALLGAFSVASNTWWRTSHDLHEAQLAMDQRIVEAAHANLTMSAVQWNNGPKTEQFTLTNSGTTPLDFTEFQYIFDGTISFAAQTSNYPKLNGVNPPTSDLLLPGDTLDCKFDLAGQPSKIMVVTQFGSIYAHYP